MSEATLSGDEWAEIHDLYMRYSRCFDGGDAEGYAMTFTADGVFHRPSSPILTGRDDLRALVRERATASPGIRHVTSNVLAEIDHASGTAQGSAYVLVLRQDPDRLLRLFNAGTYTDELATEEGRWRFRSRRYETWLAASQIDQPFASRPY